MSRREDRSSESKRHRSRFGREPRYFYMIPFSYFLPFRRSFTLKGTIDVVDFDGVCFRSPKRSRRDGKPETERPPAEPDMDKDRTDRDHRNHRRLQDPLPLESVNESRESEKGTDAQKVPPSRSFFQVAFFFFFGAFQIYCSIMYCILYNLWLRCSKFALGCRS